MAALSTCGDTDDLFFDAKRRRIYVSCGRRSGGDPCLRQQQVTDAWGIAQWTYVRVC